jgi:hypothetical protein
VIVFDVVALAIANLDPGFILVLVGEAHVAECGMRRLGSNWRSGIEDGLNNWCVAKQAWIHDRFIKMKGDSGLTINSSSNDWSDKLREESEVYLPCIK